MDQQTADVLAAFPQLYDVDRRFTPALWSYVPYAIRPSPQAVEAQRPSFHAPGVSLNAYRDACEQCKLGRKFCLTTHGTAPPCNTCFESYSFCNFAGGLLPAPSMEFQPLMGGMTFEPQAQLFLPTPAAPSHPTFWTGNGFMPPAVGHVFPGPQQASFGVQDDLAAVLGFDPALLEVLDPQPLPSAQTPQFVGPTPPVVTPAPMVVVPPAVVATPAPMVVSQPPPVITPNPVTEVDEDDTDDDAEGEEEEEEDAEGEDDDDGDDETDDEDASDGVSPSPSIPPPYPTPASSRQVSAASTYSTTSLDSQHTATPAYATPYTPPSAPPQPTQSFQADLVALLSRLHPASAAGRVSILQTYVTGIIPNTADGRRAAAALDELVFMLQKRAAHALLTALIAYHATGSFGANPAVSERLVLQAAAVSDADRLHALEQIMPSKLMFGSSPVPKDWTTAKAARRVDALMAHLAPVGKRVVIGAFIDLIFARADAHRATMEG
ncbi:uncharacterized protein LOC62_05G007505 [Vanrija pseudolonga]|uniref:Uncharacterized protein n=1 Tax=Vanrija pseudolonga TaxID=143232 RepID=A0AAF0YFG0_9TREE|nr:hypothetical protein LOC62_05G007505 [Vanrija pseudolonga]